MSNNITTGEVRFSYAYIFAPRKSRDSDEEKYSVTLLIPKSDTYTYNALLQGIEEAKQEGLQGVFQGKIPPNLAVPLYDGDGVKPSSGEAYSEECKGHWVITASNKIQPFVVDMNVQPIMQQNVFYSGCYGRASIRFFPYTTGKKGIGCSLNGVQKIRDGEALSGGISAEEAFGGGTPQAGAWATIPQQIPYQAQQSSYPVQYQNQQPANQGMPAQMPVLGQTYPQNYAGQQEYIGQPGYPQVPVDPISGRPYAGGVMGL